MSKLISVCLVLFVCCFVKYEAALSRKQKAIIHSKLLTSGLNCVKEHSLNFEHIKMFTDRKVPEDEDAKCFVKCIFKSFGMMEDDGKISEELSKKSAREIFKEGDEMLQKVDELLDLCIKVNDEETKDGDKGCDRAKLAFECFAEHAPTMGFDVEF